MTSLQDIINIAKADGGKFFVMDETGDTKLVIMGVEEYQKLLLGKLQQQIVDVEKINLEITKAQLTEHEVEKPVTIIAPTVSSTYTGGFKRGDSQDLRSEVIDPSFDFEGPKIEIDDL